MSDPAAPVQFFTRGQPGDADARGASLVEKHLQRQREAEEERQVGVLSRHCPWVRHRATLLEALRAVGGDLDAAHACLEAFGAAGGKAPAAKAPKARKRRRGNREAAAAAEEERDGDGEHAGRRGAVTGRYGKYGVIGEADRYDKQAEFGAWLAEVKRLNAESLARFEEKDLFKEFAEDYNTATLPHKKYYDLEAWERAQAAEGRGKAEGDAEPNFMLDEERRKQELVDEQRRRAEETKSRLIAQMRASGDVQAMKEQELLKSQMQMAFRTGNMAEAERLQKVLEPEDIKTKYGADKNYGFKGARAFS